MSGVINTLGIYVFLLVAFRVTGRRTLQDITLFDFVLLLVISESVQEALIGDDHSVTNALTVIATFLLLDILLSLGKQKWPGLQRILEGAPLVVVREGRPLKERMDKERIDEEDVLESARDKHGLSRFDQIRHAVIERNGGISIIPKSENGV